MTMAIEASSSTSRTLIAAAASRDARLRLARQRQVDAEMGQPAGVVAIVGDPAVHLAHQLADQREAEPLPALLGRDERLEDVVAHAPDRCPGRCR